MIKEFQCEDAQKLADMFNASDEGWPGGFTHGLAVTPERVLDNIKETNAVSIFVAWDRGKIVGYADIMEFWRDFNVSYVGLLNVMPTHHGKGFGRELLKACVEKAAQLKYNRLDLHTWAGNMKAVPLYKKTGFFWVPKTTVHMKNYLPLIFNMDAAEPYFEKHDWYKTFKRELKVEEDDFKGIFPYCWEEDGDVLSVAIDTESGRVARFENNQFVVSQKVGDAFAGKSVKVTWTLENKMKSPLNVTLIARGDEKITIEKNESIVLEGEHVITGEAFIDPDIEIKKKEEPPHVLTTDVVINGVSLSLGSGLRVKQPIALSTYPEYLFLPRGRREILVVLKNNQKITAEGVITCQNTGEFHPFCINPEYTEAVPFSIEVEDCELQFAIEGEKRIHTIPMQLMTGANVMQKGKEVVLENNYSRIVVSLSGGETTIFDKKTKKVWAKHVEDELGPPFWPSEFSKTIYTANTGHKSGKAVAEFTARSKKYDLRLIRRMEMDSSPVVKVHYRIIPQKDMSICFAGGGRMDGSILTVPLKEGIVSEPFMEDIFPLGHGDLPKDASEYREQWMCFERDGSVFGLIWETCAELDINESGFPHMTMSGGAVKPFYLYVGSGSFKDVREAWSRLHDKKVEEEEPVGIWEVTPPVLLCTDDCTQDMVIASHRGKPLKGTVNKKPFDVKRGSPFTFKTKFDKLELGVNTKYLEVETDLFCKKVPVSVVRAGKRGDTQIRIREKDIIEIDNGLYTVKVAPHFCGSVIFFGRDSNNLLTSYPEPTQFNWFKPWYGGIHPTIFAEDEFPGRMHKETFAHQIIDFQKCGITWKGCKVTSTLQEIKGLQLHTSYVTTAFSNVLVVENTVRNLTSAPFNLYSGVFFYLQPEGSMKEATLYYYQKDLYERRRTPYGGWIQCRDWAAVKGKKTFVTVIADSIEIIDFGEKGAHFFVVKEVEIAPREEVTSVLYCAAADSLEQSQQYKVLRGIKWI